MMGTMRRRSAACEPASAHALLPDFIPPELATLVDQPPGGGAWLHEIKFDGYRTAARVEGGRVRLLTRTGLDWTARFRPIATARVERMRKIERPHPRRGEWTKKRPYVPIGRADEP